MKILRMNADANQHADARSANSYGKAAGRHAVTETGVREYFPEPGASAREGNWPEFYGEAEKPMTPEQQSGSSIQGRWRKVASAEIRQADPERQNQ